jgi:hypothetical protein
MASNAHCEKTNMYARMVGLKGRCSLAERRTPTTHGGQVISGLVGAISCMCVGDSCRSSSALRMGINHIRAAYDALHPGKPPAAWPWLAQTRYFRTGECDGARLAGLNGI